MDDVTEAVDAVDNRRRRLLSLGSTFCGPAVALEAVDARDTRRVSLTWDFAVLNDVEASLLFDAVETGLESSFLLDSFELGLRVAFDGPAAAGVRMVEACERTEGVTDFGLSIDVMLLAALLLLGTVRDTRDVCEAWESDLDVWEGV